MGTEPVAITACSNWIPASPSSEATCSERSPVELGGAAHDLHAGLAPHRVLTPTVSRRTMPFFHCTILAMSTSRPCTVMPNACASRASWARSEAWISALDGMHPSLRQTPPRVASLSTRITSLPSWASRMAAT